MEGCFENPLVLANPETYRLALDTCRAILSVEDQVEDINSKPIKDKIKNKIALQVVVLVNEKPELMKYAILFWGFLGEEKL